jgi:sugar phosphate isomerase/epimerase
MKPIALQLYTLRDAMAQDFGLVLKQVADIGYVGVEFAGLHGKAPADVKKMVDDLGLQVASAHMAMPTPENAAQLIDECGTLGITKLVSGVGPDDVKTMDLIKQSAARFQAAAELLKPAGIRFGIHNHWWEFTEVDGKTPEDKLLKHAPDAFAELDVYWAEVGCGDAAGAVARLKARCPLLHVKDGHVEPKAPMTAVGAGKLDIPAILAAADPDVLEWNIVEIDAVDGDMLEAVAASYRYLTGAGLVKGNK